MAARDRACLLPKWRNRLMCNVLRIRFRKLSPVVADIRTADRYGLNLPVSGVGKNPGSLLLAHPRLAPYKLSNGIGSVTHAVATLRWRSTMHELNPAALSVPDT